MKLATKSLAIVAICSSALLSFYACKKSVNDAGSSRASSALSHNVDGVMCGFAQTEPLTAGQSIPVGSLVIENDQDNLYVTYNTTDGWTMSELHLSVDCNVDGDCTVQKSSDIAPGKFPYSASIADGGATTYTFTIPRASLGDCSCFCIYPHAVVTNGSGTETAWGGSVERIVNGKWYGGTNYCLQECGDGGGGEGK